MIKPAIDQLNIFPATQRMTELRPGFFSLQSFNFGNNYQSNRNGLKALKVFNNDFVGHNISIPLHPHQNFEILSVILEGQMSHEDNLGNSLLLEPDEVKLMSAGTGLYHGGTCYNGTNFLQIWVVPNKMNIHPEIRKMHFSPDERILQWQLQVSPLQQDNVLPINQSLYAYRGNFIKGQLVNFTQHTNAYYFLMPLKGAFNINKQKVNSLDSAEFYSQEGFEIEITEDADLWLMVQPN